MTKEEMESCLDTIGVYRSVLSFMNVANKDSCEDRDMHIENLDKLEEMLRAEWMHEQGKTDAVIPASTLVKRLMAKYDDVLSIGDVIDELNAMERGEVTIETVCD